MRPYNHPTQFQITSSYTSQSHDLTIETKVLLYAHHKLHRAPNEFLQQLADEINALQHLHCEAPRIATREIKFAWMVFDEDESIRALGQEPWTFGPKDFQP